MTEIALLTELRRDLKRDFREAEISQAEARYVVDVYYQLQDFRIQAAGQLRSEGAEPRRWAETLLHTFELLERDLQVVLGEWARRSPAGRWAQSVTGVGPVISAGLAAHILLIRESVALESTDSSEDAPVDRESTETDEGQAVLTASTDVGERAGVDEGTATGERQLTRTVGQVWRFAGLDPTVRWEKGQKRPWNARLKVLCWKLGDSFVKQSGRESDYYGHVYKARKRHELTLDGRDPDDGKIVGPATQRHQVQAAAALQARKITDKALRQCYESGHLPLGRLELRARRYAVKLFLAHYHHVLYESIMGIPPPLPFIFTDQAKAMGLGDHSHFIGPPNWPMME